MIDDKAYWDLPSCDVLNVFTSKNLCNLNNTILRNIVVCFGVFSLNLFCVFFVAHSLKISTWTNGTVVVIAITKLVGTWYKHHYAICM